MISFAYTPGTRCTRAASARGAERQDVAQPRGRTPLDGIFRSHNIPRPFPFLRHAPRRRGYFANVHDTASFPHRFFQSTAASRAMSRR